MIHYASPGFRAKYRELPEAVRALADSAMAVLKARPGHPALRLRRVGRFRLARAGLSHRMLGVKLAGGVLWFWIGGPCPLRDDCGLARAAAGTRGRWGDEAPPAGSPAGPGRA